jgi:hypothetical protein
MTMSDSVQDELQAIWDEVREPNWDGYDALPVPREALINARKLVNALPRDLPGPSAGAEPDGQLTLEWYRDPRCTLSVSVGHDNELHFAALLGKNSICGTASFVDQCRHQSCSLYVRYTRIDCR